MDVELSPAFIKEKSYLRTQEKMQGKVKWFSAEKG